MTRIIYILFLIAVLAKPISAQEDILGKILAEVGFDRTDLGYQSKGYWNRFPLDIPYKLGSFDDLFAEPLYLYDYARVMSNTVDFYMNPQYADSSYDGLYKLVYNLGVDKKLGGFRSYSANLIDLPKTDDPLGYAIEQLFQFTGTQTELYSFGSKAPMPDYRLEINQKCQHLPDTVKTIIAHYIVNLVEAARWHKLAFRNCNPEDMRKARAIRDLASTQGDGMKYYPELDDIAQTIDYASLHYAALKVAATTEFAEYYLKALRNKVPADFQMEMNTPLGMIAIFSDVYKREKLPPTKSTGFLRSPINGYYEYDKDNIFLLIDFGRNMIYNGTAGAAISADNPISVLLDLGGNDYYGYDKKKYQPNAGVGLLGIGLVLDSDGDDIYNGSIYAQGAGLFGVGVLFDKKGNDKYNAELSAQGCGYFGIGLCFDAEGNDEYYLFGDGQGMGGIGGGVGVLADYSGDDKYTAEPFADKFDRGDYHSENKINGNVAQGAGFGRRGDGSDGHAWAGGLGAIIDINGNDKYTSGNWTLGVGYWYGTGIAVDRNGDDLYKSCYFTQGSGAHFCNGILLDENGDDTHDLFETAGAALGFGWDYTNAFLIDKNGNDFYSANMISMGVAQIRSNAFLIDIGGDDRYQLKDKMKALGEATYRADYLNPSQLTPYYTYAKSFAGFIDIGGDDKYFLVTDKGLVEHPLAKNNSTWFQPNHADSTYGANNFGIGIDIEAGTIPEFSKWDK